MAESKLLEGRVALVTGASRGIGEEIARRFSREGAAVGVTARTLNEGDHRFAGSVTTTVDEIRASGGTATAVAADLSHPEDRERIVHEIERELGPIDILVNNAAITFFTPVEDFDLRRYQLMFDVQVLAPFHLAQLVLPGMRTVGAGWILNISSPAALHPVGPPFRSGGGTVYGMCKAAIERFSTGLASELYEDAIAVNSLAPTGLVVTPGVKHHRLDQFIPEERHEPVEVMAEAALLLCSRPAAEITGRVAFSQELLFEFGLGPKPSQTRAALARTPEG
jgi:NAD(P)-dependent dehydrogenase (short-subunit alcohol dehydrogenase family)